MQDWGKYKPNMNVPEAKINIAQQSITSEGPTLPLLEDYARLNILSRTTKGLFPDVVPDEKTLKELIEHFSDEQGAVLASQA